jgi:cytochrome bd-type quinol oxidase subunit 1
LNFWSSDAISSSAVWILSVLAWPQNPNMFATLPSSFLGVYQNPTRCYFLSCILILLLRC